MNNQLLLALRTTRDSAVPAITSDPMLTELLALHEEMVEQLRTESPHGLTTAAFLQSMIEQHSSAAALLRARLEGGENA